MSAIVLDTHTAVWSLFSPHLLSPAAQLAIDEATNSQAPVYIASISLIEVSYLVEKGRINPLALTTLINEVSSPTGQMTLVSLDLAIVQSLQQVSRNAVPELPDRVIAATALRLGIPLVTRDLKIRSSSIQTIW